MKNKQIMTVLAIVCGAMGYVYGSSGIELPADFPGVTVTTYDSAKVAEGHIFLAVASETPGIGTYLMILQNDGTPVWYQKVETEEIYDFKMLPSGLLSYGPFIEAHSFAGGGDVVHEILDSNYNLIETITGGNGYVAESHDFNILPNGHVLQFGYYRSQVDMSQIVSGGHPAALVAGAVVQELDTQRNVIFQWRTWDYTTFEDYFSKILTDPNIKKAVINGWHLNTINLDIDGHLLVATPQSGANLPVTSGWIKKINRQTGETLWHLGSKENQFTFVGVTEAEGLEAFSGHAFYRLENGNFLIYDNGSRQNTRKSKVYEFQLDEVNKIATYVWSYVPTAMISGHHRGNAQRLPNGNTFIGWGGAAGRDIPACTEVDPLGQIVHEMKFNNLAVESYRAFRFVWPPNQKTAHTEYELVSGNTYAFGETGVTMEVIDRTGDGYNEATVTREPYAPVNPLFPGKAPQALPVRVKVDRFGIQSITANMFFDAESFGFKDPGSLTVYHREFPGQGLFIPLPTEYNPVSKQLKCSMNQFGEFIFGYPDIAEVPFAPLLAEPESDRGVQHHEVIMPVLAETGKIYAVNQTLPIYLSWSPKGFAQFYRLQISTDTDFTNLVVDEAWMTEAQYRFTIAVPNAIYFYRVNTTNEGGTGEWSQGSFVTVPPMIEVIDPDGNQTWKRGLSSFIRWQDNIREDVTIDLYQSGTLIKTIATVASNGAYSWPVSLDLQAGCGYSIRISSSTNPALFDQSNKPFNLDTAYVAGDFDCDGCVDPDDLMVFTNDWLKEQAGHPADLDSSGRVDIVDLAIVAENWMKSCL